MSPPIRDGSGSSIGSIRLGDGSEIAEVRTGAGDVLFSAIPDSVVHRYDAKELSLSDGDSSFVWADLEGSADLSPIGGATYQTGSLNGNSSVLYDGGGDAHEGSFSTTVTQPNFTIGVIQIEGNGDNPAERVWSSSDQNERQIVGVNSDSNNDNWLIFAGKQLIDGPNFDNSPHLIGVDYDGASTALRYDGNEAATGDAGVNDLPGIRLGSDPGDTSFGNFRAGEVWVMDSPTSQEIIAAESKLSDKWGITL